MAWFTLHSVDESLERQAVDSESGGVEWENSRVELEVVFFFFKLTFNLILFSHTFELWLIETCVCAPSVWTCVGFAGQ